jgi:hypothetical protein
LAAPSLDARVVADNEMKAALYAQFNPVKTMAQLIGDRCVLRICILASFAIAACC